MKNEREKALFLAQLKDFANTLSDKIAVNDEWTIKGFIDIFKNIGSTPILVDKGQKGRGTASCNLPATRYIIEANPLNVLKPRAFRFAACIMELIPSQTAFVMRW